jgi:hypothetical protein
MDRLSTSWVIGLSSTLFFILFTLTSGISQEVIISSDIDLKNDKKYVVLGKMEEHILLFRDRVNSQEVDVLDTNLKLKYTREVNFSRDNPRIIAVLPSRDNASIIYTVTDKDTLSFHQHIINHLGEMQDTIELGRFDKKRFKSNFKYAFSEDQNKVVIFNNGRDDKINLFIIDLAAKKIQWETEIIEYDTVLDYKFKDMIITNREDILMLYEKGNNRAIAKTHAILLTHIAEGMDEPSLVNFEMPQNLSKDIHLAYDEGNDAVLILGLYTEANRSAALGYFYFREEVANLTSNPELYFHQFDEYFIQKVNGRRRGVNNTLDYYFIKDVVFQRDGSFIWVGEMYKEYIRRSPSPYGRTSGLAGYVDHYTEDVIIVNVDASDNELWKNVIYKKQFSQDDEAIYSSFAVMQNPSRLQLIFNDEIKKNNTVSTYALDPVGNMQRRTVLNTEYENLKLRFQEAEQISDNSMLVISEGSGVLNLVKITF